MCCLGRCHENSAFFYDGNNYSGKDIENLANIKDKKVKSAEPVDLLKEEEIVTKDNKKIHLNRFDLFDEDE